MMAKTQNRLCEAVSNPTKNAKSVISIWSPGVLRRAWPLANLPLGLLSRPSPSKRSISKALDGCPVTNRIRMPLNFQAAALSCNELLLLVDVTSNINNTFDTHRNCVFVAGRSSRMSPMSLGLRWTKTAAYSHEPRKRSVRRSISMMRLFTFKSTTYC